MSTQTPPAPPDHLSDRAADLWRAIAEEYVLVPHQLEVLRRALEAADRADEARELLAAEGLTVTDRYDQVKPHPAANIERDSRLAEARLLRELALSPAEEDPRPPRLGDWTTGSGR